jgi:UDP-glucose 4-epimerase
VRVLVTGGAGFIGSHVCDALIASKHEVVIMDDLSTGRRENIPSGASLELVDIRSPHAHAFVRKGRFDAICHLAAQMDVRRSVADPQWDADVNIRGLLNICEAATRSGLKRFVFASTGGALYGEQDQFPAPETHPTRPVSPYGVAKAACELYLNYYGIERKLSWISLRFSNVYGPRQSPEGEAGVVAIFCNRLLSGEGCTIYGDGKQTRDFVYVGDVARAMASGLTNTFTGPVNIGTGVETEVATLYQKLAAIAGITAPPLPAPERAGEQKRSAIDASLAARILGWKPTVSLDEGLRNTFDAVRASRAKALH